MTTQEKIINVATQEFLNSGYLGASLRKIAKAAHVTTGAMYGYYKNKEALFNDIVEEVSEEFKNDYLVEGMVLMINYHILLIIHIYLVFLKLSVIK